MTDNTTAQIDSHSLELQAFDLAAQVLNELATDKETQAGDAVLSVGQCANLMSTFGLAITLSNNRGKGEVADTMEKAHKQGTLILNNLVENGIIMTGLMGDFARTRLELSELSRARMDVINTPSNSGIKGNTCG